MSDPEDREDEYGGDAIARFFNLKPYKPDGSPAWGFMIYRWVRFVTIYAAVIYFGLLALGAIFK